MSAHVDVAIFSPITGALAGETVGAPLHFHYGPEEAGQSVCFFVDDHALAERIAAAVNKAIADHAAHQPQEQALAS